MATIECEGTTKEIQDGEGLQETCEAFGIPFACNSGVCGACRIDVVEGSENLSDLTEMEEEINKLKNVKSNSDKGTDINSTNK